MVPSDVGKIPKKIVSSFDGFNADEYKNWTLLYSIFALKGVIPKEHLDCFRKFVLACQYITMRVISRQDVVLAHELIRQFCMLFEKLYGKHKVTPNMHLHCHLKECILDYGPIYSFWLFAFERYNGILGNMPTNKKNIEQQIMKRFCRDSFVLNFTRPNQYADAFNTVFDKLEKANSQRGTLCDMECVSLVELCKLSSR